MTSGNQPTESILPSPFAWCEIPDLGVVYLRPSRDFDLNDETEEPQIFLEEDVYAYAIAKYPITNAQFGKFIEAGGYQTERWWTQAGWSLCQAGTRYINRQKVPTGKPWTEPLFWHDEKWNGADYPVVGVTWYEAHAFCRWLSELSGEKIRLPDTYQWQRAAAQDDKVYRYTYSLDAVGRRFPWGNEWDASRCNNNADNKGIGGTSPVRQYEGKGDSYFGVVDMAGNVWEWCFTKISGLYREMHTEEGENDRETRGGSWIDNANEWTTPWGEKTFAKFFRADYRNGAVADYCDFNIGFRIARNYE